VGRAKNKVSLKDKPNVLLTKTIEELESLLDEAFRRNAAFPQRAHRRAYARIWDVLEAKRRVLRLINPVEDQLIRPSGQPISSRTVTPNEISTRRSAQMPFVRVIHTDPPKP
jgi:hypothetical protein